MGFALLVLGVVIWGSFMHLMEPHAMKVAVPPDKIRAALPDALQDHYDKARGGIEAAKEAWGALMIWVGHAGTLGKIVVVVVGVAAALGLIGFVLLCVGSFFHGLHAIGF